MKLFDVLEHILMFLLGLMRIRDIETMNEYKESDLGEARRDWFKDQIEKHNRDNE